MRIPGEILGAHTDRIADARSGFADEPTVALIVLEITGEPIDFKIIAPNPFRVSALPVRASRFPSRCPDVRLAEPSEDNNCRWEYGSRQERHD